MPSQDPTFSFFSLLIDLRRLIAQFCKESHSHFDLQQYPPRSQCAMERRCLSVSLFRVNLDLGSLRMVMDVFCVTGVVESVCKPITFILQKRVEAGEG